MREENPKVTCTDCGFEWFGNTSAHALRILGSCTRCRGELRFAEEAPLPPLAEPALDVPPHLALGAPRI